MSDGKRGGIVGSEIADTIEAVFAYFQSTQQNNPTLLHGIEQEAAGWSSKVSALRGADQTTVDAFFGQPAPRDVTETLKAAGITEENTPKSDYSQHFLRAYGARRTDASCYWPKKVVPTLHNYRKLLAFDAYRERLDGVENGAATTLVKRLDAFEGASGETHLSVNGLLHSINRYIWDTPRHASEVYAKPEQFFVDYHNAFHVTYNNHISWKPTKDAQSVTTILYRGGSDAEKSFSVLASEKAMLDFAFSRASIMATVEARLGKTYGEDALVVTMSMDHYTKRYVPIMQGKIVLDTRTPGSSYAAASIATSDIYYDYEPGKNAFFDERGLLISTAAMKLLDSESVTGDLAAAKETLKFLRETKLTEETMEQIPTGQGHKDDFILLRRREFSLDETVYEFEGTYYSSCDMARKIRESFAALEATANGRGYPSRTNNSNPRAEDVVSFEHNGDMYVPQGEAFSQLALYMKYTYGTTYTWVIDNDEARKKAGQNARKYVISTSTISPDIREAAMADFTARLAVAKKLAAEPPKQSIMRSKI